MWMFINGQKRKRKAKASPKTRTARKGRKRMARRKQSAAQRRASLKNLAKARRARGGAKRRRRNPPPGGHRTAKWRRKAVRRRSYSYGAKQKRVIRTNPRHHRRRRYHRNPGFSFGGITSQLVGGAKLVGGIYLGKGVTNFVAAKIPVDQTGWMGYAVKLGVGLVGTMGVRRFMGPEWAKAFLAGAIMSVTDPFAKSLPIIGASLGDDSMGEYVPVGYEYPAVGAYETSVGESVPVGAYETSVGMY